MYLFKQNNDRELYFNGFTPLGRAWLFAITCVFLICSWQCKQKHIRLCRCFYLKCISWLKILVEQTEIDREGKKIVENLLCEEWALPTSDLIVSIIGDKTKISIRNDFIQDLILTIMRTSNKIKFEIILLFFKINAWIFTDCFYVHLWNGFRMAKFHKIEQNEKESMETILTMENNIENKTFQSDQFDILLKTIDE